MKKHPALEMYDYNVWANDVIINRLKELPQEDYHKDVQSEGYSSVAKVLTHIYLVERAWFDIISGQSMNDAMTASGQLAEEIVSKKIDEMGMLFTDLTERNKSLLNKQEDMDKEMVVDNPYAGLLETTVSESVLHVVTHANYHRGNIATMLRQLGHTSVMQDYGLYLYAKREERITNT